MKASRTPRRRTPLNPERIALAALELIDAEGLPQFSARKLAGKLGCAPMAIYHHFASLELLLDATLDLMMSELSLPPRRAGGWQEQIRALARALRQLGIRHADAFPLVATRRFNTPSTHQLLNSILVELLDAGFTPIEAATIFRTVGTYCSGAVLDELAGRDYARRPQGELRAFDPTTHTALAKVAPQLAKSEQLFDNGVALLVAGIEARYAKK